MKKYILLVALVITIQLSAQINNYTVALEPINISGLMGIQSFAHAQHDNKWLIIGGRLDGLHKRQPFAAFDAAGHNTNIYVVDPINEQQWSASLSSLPTALQEQLSSTNPNFHQEGNMLYFIGGYGYSNTAADHITYNQLTAIDVPGLMNAIINASSITSYFRQITDPAFAVTGGHLKKVYDTYYLVGGQKFDGRYNPMGHNTYVQVYSNQIRKFKIDDDGVNLTITHLPYYTDTINLHRRDYNVCEQIMPNGQEGLTAFSGVFQYNIDLPYLNCVNIDSSGYLVNNSFSQYYNHYHCATMPIYDSINNEMHTFFFGGIAQYFDNGGILTQDNNVPFVNTIARVSRNSGGVMTEYKMPTVMPALLGAGSEFILNLNNDLCANNVIKLNSITTDTTLVGYIFGGISSTAANVFFSNAVDPSTASNSIFKVLLILQPNASIAEPNPQSTGSLKMMVYPNPNNGKLVIRFYMEKMGDIDISISDQNGKIIVEEHLTDLAAGDQELLATINDDKANGVYFVKLRTPHESAIQKIVLDR
jgi:hypothetical protein